MIRITRNTYKHYKYFSNLISYESEWVSVWIKHILNVMSLMSAYCIHLTINQDGSCSINGNSIAKILLRFCLLKCLKYELEDCIPLLFLWSYADFRSEFLWDFMIEIRKRNQLYKEFSLRCLMHLHLTINQDGSCSINGNSIAKILLRFCLLKCLKYELEDCIPLLFLWSYA